MQILATLASCSHLPKCSHHPLHCPHVTHGNWFIDYPMDIIIGFFLTLVVAVTLYIIQMNYCGINVSRLFFFFLKCVDLLSCGNIEVKPLP